MHTTDWDQHWGGDETRKVGLVYVAWLLLSQCLNVCKSASPYLIGLRSLVVTKNAYFSLQATFICDTW